MTIAELFRLLCNLIRIGIVTQVNIQDCTARVSTGDNETDWVRWATSRAGGAVIWHAPSIGEQVIILSPCGEMASATIIGSLYSTAHPAPDSDEQSGVITWPDGAQFSYNPAQSALTITGTKTLIINNTDSINVTCKSATLTADTAITLDAPNVICTRQLTAATLQITEGGGMKGNITHTDGTLTSNGVAVDNHSHGNVQSGSSWTEGTK